MLGVVDDLRGQDLGVEVQLRLGQHHARKLPRDARKHCVDLNPDQTRPDQAGRGRGDRKGGEKKKETRYRANKTCDDLNSN